MGGGGGGGEITLVLESFFLHAPEPGFLVFGWYGLGFFFSQDHAYKNIEKVYYILKISSLAQQMVTQYRL